MKTEIEVLNTKLAEALKMIKRLADIVEVYGPEYAHGERTDRVVKQARKLLAGNHSPTMTIVSAAEFVAQPKGQYD